MKTSYCSYALEKKKKMVDHLEFSAPEIEWEDEQVILGSLHLGKQRNMTSLSSYTFLQTDAKQILEIQ